MVHGLVGVRDLARRTSGISFDQRHLGPLGRQSRLDRQHAGRRLARISNHTSYGPIVSYDLLCLLSPALAGWSAFVLCHYVVRSGWPAMLGGLLFAFSPYVLSRMLGNMDLTLVWPIPLRRVCDAPSNQRQFGHARFRRGTRDSCRRAVFVLRRDRRQRDAVWRDRAFARGARDGTARARRLFATAALSAAAYAVAAVIVSPYLYYMFAFPTAPGAIFSPWHFAIDLTSLVIPTTVNQLGREPFFAPIAYQFRAEMAETGAYLGLPLLAIVILFARERWNAPGGRFLVHLVAVICVLAMGPRLEFAGRFVIGLPAPHSPACRCSTRRCPRASCCTRTSC